MEKGQITCSACSHVFAVPANARAAICPRCGQALPVFAGSIEPTEVPAPRPKPPSSAPSRTPSAANIARIKLKKQEPARPPPVPPSGPPTYSTVPDRTGIQQDLPPLPAGEQRPALSTDGAEFIPIETDEVVSDDESATETYDPIQYDGSLEEDELPLPPDYDDATDDQGWDDLATSQQPPPAEGAGGYPEELDLPPPATGIDLPPRPPSGAGRAFTLPWGSDQMNAETVPGEQPDDPLLRMPTLPEGADARVPPPPDMDGAPSLPPPSRPLDLPPPPDMDGAPSLPPPPSRPLDLPPPPDMDGAPSLPSPPSPPPGMPPPPPGFGELGSPAPPMPDEDGLPTLPAAQGAPPAPPPAQPKGHSQRVRALDRAISEVIETGPEAQAAAGPGRARTLALEERPPPPVPPRSAGPQAEEDAPVSLGHSGIMVAIPDQPIEEVQAGAARPAQPKARARRAHSHPPTNELAPISRPPPKVKGGQGSALREQQTSRPNWMVYALIGGVGLAVVVVAVIVIISLVTK